MPLEEMKTSLRQLNGMDEEGFVAAIGHVFEHSPWIARQTFAKRPFASLAALHEALVKTVRQSSDNETLDLIRAHPDLVGKMARAGGLTRESTAEQDAAGLTALSAAEVQQFDRYNAQYRERFGFPFVICARENKKDAILAAFPVRLNQSREAEIDTTLTEIARIARMRLLDAIEKD
ncbi:MAG TPA: 2-oxo-4-hydroxy-4-carboxy-5-ureidoimidazoline decarboxylase [Tepidisphaeraceae bacterium]|nr:2-oxo-4-hydroxy-4-carboxy-5-ureidoimidazoline decarboxylase [Tepidisphaeraceae bacterium]